MEIAMSLSKFAIIVAAATIGTAAQAQELSTSSSSGTMTITVYIPPIAPAIQAASGGAVGLWTIDGQFNGMMLRVGDVGGNTPVTLYTRPGNLVALSAGSGTWSAQSIVQAGTSVNDGGLIKSDFQSPVFRHAESITVIGL